jgi:hypothetical protein
LIRTLAIRRIKEMAKLAIWVMLTANAVELFSNELRVERLEILADM